MRIASACLFASLVVVLPLTAAETPAAGPAATPQAADARVAGFLLALGQAGNCSSPAPSPRLQVAPIQPQPARRLDSWVDCDQCGGPQGPGFQCTRICMRRGLCTDQCYADASTCQLVDCVCLLC
jgi:hypothetical protein